jgi:hypothetical protein
VTTPAYLTGHDLRGLLPELDAARIERAVEFELDRLLPAELRVRVVDVQLGPVPVVRLELLGPYDLVVPA